MPLPKIFAPGVPCSCRDAETSVGGEVREHPIPDGALIAVFSPPTEVSRG